MPPVVTISCAMIVILVGVAVFVVDLVAFITVSFVFLNTSVGFDLFVAAFVNGVTFFSVDVVVVDTVVEVDVVMPFVIKEFL